MSFDRFVNYGHSVLKVCRPLCTYGVSNSETGITGEAESIGEIGTFLTLISRLSTPSMLPTTTLTLTPPSHHRPWAASLPLPDIKVDIPARTKGHHSAHHSLFLSHPGPRAGLSPLPDIKVGKCAEEAVTTLRILLSHTGRTGTTLRLISYQPQEVYPGCNRKEVYSGCNRKEVYPGLSTMREVYPGLSTMREVYPGCNRGEVYPGGNRGEVYPGCTNGRERYTRGVLTVGRGIPRVVERCTHGGVPMVVYSGW